MEIERKFLVDRVPGEPKGSPGVSVEQGYLAIDEESEVRLRRSGDSLTLTVKGGHGESREETEVHLDPDTFADLWPRTEGRRVEKTRRKIGLGDGLVAELDEYLGGLEGAAVVEVEFDSPSAASDFDPPDWFGRELTGDRAWANQSLALNGRPEKSLEFRLRPGEGAVSGIRRVAASRLAQAAAAVRSAGAEENSAEKVHEARKSPKKARSAIRLLRGTFEDEHRSAANRSCRDAARRLSGPRDAEVKLAVLASMNQGRPEPKEAESWRRQLEAEAESHRQDLRPENLREVVAEIEAVRRQFQTDHFAGESSTVAANASRAYRAGRNAMKKAKKTGKVDHFHDWRKRSKDLRYQLEILEPRLPGRFSRLRGQAEELSELLGDLHDFDVLLGDLAARDLPETERKSLERSIRKARKRQIRACLDLGSETYEMKPGRFKDRLDAALSEA